MIEAIAIPTGVLLVSILFVFMILRTGRKNYGFLENCGFPVITPTLFLGSVPNYHKQVQALEDIKRYKKYGPIWGLYHGNQPHLYICDPELIRLIFVKNFDSFYNRREMILGGIMTESVGFLTGEKWKKVRTMLSPFFTTSKLKSMVDVIETHGNEYVQELTKECLSTKEGKLKFECGKRISAYLIDMFTRTVLGVKLEDSSDPDSPFNTAFRSILGSDSGQDWLHTLSLSLPILSKLSPNFAPVNEDVILKVINDVIINSPRNSKEIKGYNHLWHEILDQLSTHEMKSLGITPATVISQIGTFYLGGFDTSTITISNLLYYLAKNPEKQHTLYEEIISKFPDLENNNQISYQSIKENEMPYLVACIKESLRLCPPVTRLERVCTRNWSYKDENRGIDIRIKKGTNVFIPCWAVHRARDIKENKNPEEFRPERWIESKETIDPYEFTTFGFGPRSCVGERFAYESIKLIMIHLIKSFKVVGREDTMIKYKPGTMFMATFEPLYLDLVIRKENAGDSRSFGEEGYNGISNIGVTF